MSSTILAGPGRLSPRVDVSFAAPLSPREREWHDDATDAADHLRMIAALEAETSRLRARQVALLADLARRRTLPLGDGSTAEDVLPAGEVWEFAAADLMAALHWTRSAATARLDEATRLVAELPGTLARLAEGEIDHARARVVLRATADLDEAQARAVDAAVAPRLGVRTTSGVRALCAREVAAVDAGAAGRRHERRVAERRVGVQAEGDGIASLTAIGPAPEVLAVFDALTARARAAAAGSRGGQGPPGDGATDTAAEPAADPGVDARRFDALVHTLVVEASVAAPDAGRGRAGGHADGVLGAADSGPTGSRPVVRAAVNVTVALPTLVGLDDAPGELAGYGPIPAHLARQLARDGVLRRLVTDPVTGALVGVDSHTHPGGLVVDPPDPPDPPDPAAPPDPPAPPVRPTPTIGLPRRHCPIPGDQVMNPGRWRRRRRRGRGRRDARGRDDLRPGASRGTGADVGASPRKRCAPRCVRRQATSGTTGRRCRWAGRSLRRTLSIDHSSLTLYLRWRVCSSLRRPGARSLPRAAVRTARGRR